MFTLFRSCVPPECKLATVYIESLHSITGVNVRPTDSPGSRKVAIGKEAVLPHHRLADIEYLVGDVLKQYCNNLRGHPFSIATTVGSSSDPGSGPSVTSGNYNTATSGDTVQSRSPSTISTSIAGKIQDEFELSRILKEVGVIHDTNLNDKKDHYLHSCSSVVKDIRSRISPLDLNENSISGYRIGTFQWRAKELDRGASTKTVFSVFKDQDAQSGGGGCDIHISLKGETM